MRKSLLNTLKVILASVLLLSFALFAAQRAFADDAAGGAPLTIEEGASLRLETSHNGLRFSAVLNEDPDAAAEYHMMIFPAEYLEDYTSGDYYEYLTAFIAEKNEQFGTDVVLSDLVCEPVLNQSDGTYRIRASITDVLFDNSARDFTAIAYKLKDGERVYTSAVTRNLAQTAVAALQSGDYADDAEVLSVINEYVVNGIKKASGLGENDPAPEYTITAGAGSVLFFAKETEQEFAVNVTDGDGGTHPELNKFVYAVSSDPRVSYSNGKVIISGEVQESFSCELNFMSPGFTTCSSTVLYSEKVYGNTDNTVLNLGYGDNLLGEEYAYLWSSTDGSTITATEYTAEYTTLHRETESTTYYYLNAEYLKELLQSGYNMLVMNVTAYTKVSSATFEYTIEGEAPVKMGWMGNDEYSFVLNSDYAFDFSSLTEEEIGNITSAGICFNGYTGSTDADWNFKYAKFRKKVDASAYDGENLATEEFAGVWSSDAVKVTYDNQSFAESGRYGTLWESENNVTTAILLDNLFFKEILERGYTQLHVRFNAFSPNMDFKIEFEKQYYFFPTGGLFEALPDTDYNVDLSGVNTSVITASSGSHFAVYVPSYTADGWYVQWVDISFQKPA